MSFMPSKLLQERRTRSGSLHRASLSPQTEFNFFHSHVVGKNGLGILQDQLEANEQVVPGSTDPADAADPEAPRPRRPEDAEELILEIEQVLGRAATGTELAGQVHSGRLALRDVLFS